VLGYRHQSVGGVWDPGGYPISSSAVIPREPGGGELARELPDQLAVPEICQKLRYAQPRVASRPNPRQRLSPARLRG
jgi:hypothetical protein